MPSVLFKIATWVQMRRVHTSGDANWPVFGAILGPTRWSPTVPHARSVGRSGNFSSGTTDDRGANGGPKGWSPTAPLGDGFQGTSACETTWKEMKGVSWMGYMLHARGWEDVKEQSSCRWKENMMRFRHSKWFETIKSKVIGGEEKRCGDVAMWCCGDVMMLLMILIY